MIPKQSTIAAALAASAHLTMASPVRRADASAAAAVPYEPTWESTDTHNAAPEWFRDAKLGVYWHWGAFSTPQYGFEWYPRNMYFSGSSERAHHTAVYGNPDTVFPYHNFTLGGTDLAGNHVEFAPVLKSAGGVFDPDAWMAAVVGSGARYAGPVAEHHDGYSMWESKVNEWNSVRLGPKLDLVKLWAGLVREKGLKFMIATHQAFNINGYFAAAKEQTDPSLRKLYGQWGGNRTAASQYWLDKQVEAMDHVQPDLIYHDFALNSPGYCQGNDPICAIEEAQRLDFLATYFNRGVAWAKEIVTTFKRFDTGFNDTSAVADYERGGPAELTRPYWQTDDAISSSSWSYTVGMSYYSSKAMIHSLLDRVSKGGNMLLNVSPTAAGILPDAQLAVLRDIGAYMSRYGEAIYSTRAWDIYGEGPNKAGGEGFTSPLQGNSSDLRFTRSKDEKVLYVTLLGWPANGQTNIASLGSNRNVDLSGLRSVQLFGQTAGSFTNVIGYQQSPTGLAVNMATAQPGTAYGYVLKLTFAERIPVPQPAQGATVWPQGGQINASTKGVTLGLGDFRGIFLHEAGLDGADIGVIKVSAGSKVSVFAGQDLTGDVVAQYTAGEHVVALGSVGSIRIATA